MPIRLIVFDIDGVLTEGEAQALDLDLLGQLARMNQAARQDANCPAVTLCTGRPAPYLELMLQAIDGHLPGVFENGAGLYMPGGYRFLRHPNLSDGSSMRQVRQQLESTLIHSGQAMIQPGKEHSLTLFATDPERTGELRALAQEALGPLCEGVDLVYSTSCLNIIPRGIHKAKGIEFLAEQSGYEPAELLGVGDSDVDIEFLQLVGYSAAPSNAVPEVRAVVQYVSPYRTSEGVRDILRHFELLGGGA